MSVRRKVARPLDRRKWIHLVLKSDKAKGKLSFLAMRNRVWVEQLVRAKASQFGVQLAEFANVGNHLHLLLRIPSRTAFQKFLRSISGRIARYVTGACRGRKFGRFWQGLAFTRILKSRLEHLHLRGYLEANRLEAEHSVALRELYLVRLNRWIHELRYGTG